MSAESSARIIRAMAAGPAAGARRAAQGERQRALRALADALDDLASALDSSDGAPLPMAVLVLADGTDSGAALRVHSAGCDLAQAVGLLDMGQMELYVSGSTPIRPEGTD
jgi:hypothetical protein